MSYFFELADEWRRPRIKEGVTASLLYMDLCGMKFYNRRFGFSEGDKLLRRFADILKKHFSNENCSRFGADHFCVFTDAEGLEEKLRSIFEEFSGTDKLRSLPVRVGICLDNDGVLDVSTECDRAKYACDTMKNSFVSTFCYFNDSMLKKAENVRYIIANIDRAISEKWIQVHYQPIIRTASGRVCNEEALARWVDPEKGVIMPCDFIPVLEEAKLIWKLDLCVLEQMLEKMKLQRESGLYIVSESVNLSRIDFDVCNIVEEIRRRVDDAGIARELINIEITESALGIDFEFMKSQIERFRSLGFNVWLDDFGCGYSSLDVLQSIHFDLIKFDMHFMREFSNGDKSRIILTEMIKMAVALKIETICEGVETEEQLNFLRDVGCTKAQGFYFCRAIPLEEIIERYRLGIQVGFEDPAQSDYFAAIGRVNLYDLAILANDDREVFDHYFNTLPMAIIESNGDDFLLVRCNDSYRDFLKKNLGLSAPSDHFAPTFNEDYFGSTFLNHLRECGENGDRQLVNDELDNGTTIHSFIRRVAVNPVSGTKALAVVILSVSDSKDSAMNFTQIARALSSDYISLYHVNINTGKFFEYKSDPATGGLAVKRYGDRFFYRCKTDAKKQIYADDLKSFLSSFSKKKIVKAIESHGAFTLGYRLLIDGKPTYVSLKAVRKGSDRDHIIIGVNNVDAQMRQKEALERINEERITYSRISALSGDYLCIYTVDPQTDKYVEYMTKSEYEILGIPKQGENFFTEMMKNIEGRIYKEDFARFYSLWSKEKVMREIAANGVYSIKYRILIKGKPTGVRLRAAMVKEKDGPQLIIGIINSDFHLKNEQ